MKKLILQIFENRASVILSLEISMLEMEPKYINWKLQYSLLPWGYRQYINSHGRKLIAVCINSGAVIINNLETPIAHLCGGLTFQKKLRWISEIDRDLCICSKPLINMIQNVDVINDTQMPSDHGPISVTLLYDEQCDLNDLVRRSTELLDYTHLQRVSWKPSLRRPVRYDTINQDMLRS